MSRKGKQPIPLPSNVTVERDGNSVIVKGPKTTLTLPLDVPMNIEKVGAVLKVEPSSYIRNASKWHGLYRSLISNMVIGVTSGFEKILELNGVGYRAIIKGQDLELQLGFSHPVVKKIPQGIEVLIEKTRMTIKGSDKQKVGLFASQIRALRPPEPYLSKGSQEKGIRYKGEYVRKKAGKAGGRK